MSLLGSAGDGAGEDRRGVRGRLVARGLLPGGTPPFARLEREGLCETALRSGPEAPTRCGEWDVAHLVAHLLVREREPLTAAGIVVPRLAAAADRAVEHRAAADFAGNVARLREPGVSPFAVPLLERLVNTLEFFVHHEDIRRSGAVGPPRSLPLAGRDDLWRALGMIGGMLVRGAGSPVGLRRTDGSGGPDAESATTILRRRRGSRSAPVTVVGDTGEIVLFCYGRGEVADVRIEGDEVSVRRLRAAGLGL